MIRLRHYLTADGRDPFGSWLRRLRDLNARARVELRLARLERGLFGDCKPVGEGVSELRIDWGPGYRVYFCRDGDAVVILLAGGDKRTQAKDIANAIDYRKDYQTRQRNR
jgi:putative addiction module killer protein